MTVEIGSRWLESLIEKRALVREALQSSKLEDFPTHILRKGSMIVLVSKCEEGKYRCYECSERIKKGEGLMLKVVEMGTLKLTGKKFESCIELYFHKYHF